MLNRAQIFNYLTLISAVCTIYFALWSMSNEYNPIISVILMCVMLIFNYISRKMNRKENIHTKNQKKVVSNIKIKSEEN
ncbi:MAG: hypothetical protein PHD15_06710 [Clostridia bacterium]|nr:hypothetical protein [Clostridia bacterium]MDD4387420.1 hypothetical protein [Clostridia bacterium]